MASRLFLGFTFAFLTLSLLAVSLVFVLNWSYGKKKKSPPAVLQTSRVIILVLCCLVYVSLFFSEYAANHFHVRNILGLCASVFVLQILRALLDHLEARAAHRAAFTMATFKKNFVDFFANSTIFTGIYLAIMFGANKGIEGELFRYPGYALCAFNIFRVLKYRLYDDLYLRTLEKGGSYLGPPAKPGITLLQGLFNVLLRSYFFVAVSFGCIYAIMVGGQLGTESSRSLFSANKDNLSGNVFVDLLYFSVITISTVGYGDISPVAEVPKILCMVEIVLGYFFIGALLAVITGNYGSGRN